MLEGIKISLAAARVNANLTQKGLADACHVSEKTVFNWETGNSLPSVKHLNALEAALGISLNYIDFAR